MPGAMCEHVVSVRRPRFLAETCMWRCSWSGPWKLHARFTSPRLHCPLSPHHQYSSTLQKRDWPYFFLARLYPKTLVLVSHRKHDAVLMRRVSPDLDISRDQNSTLFFWAQEHKPEGCRLRRNRRTGSRSLTRWEMTHFPISVFSSSNP